MDITQFDGTIKAMTVSVLASLPTAWPEYLTGYGGHGTLLVRVAENSFRRLPDAGRIEPDVIARALVYMPEGTISQSSDVMPAHLARLTIRYVNTELDYDYLKLFPEMQDYTVRRVEQYRGCVEQIKLLPVIDFWELGRTWPVDSQPATGHRDGGTQ